MRRVGPQFLIAAMLLLVRAAGAEAQLQIATIHGTVTGPDRQAVPAATILLLDGLGNTIASSVTRADGTFDMAQVAPGSYVIRVDLGGRVLLARTLVVRGSLPVELSLQTGSIVSEDIVVRGDASSNAPERPWSVAGEAIREVAEAIPSQRVQGALASLPGWMAEDNGLLHVRGVDDGLLYVQDGIPVYERVDRLFGMPPNPSGIASLHVMNGYIPPEFGFKSGAVVEVRSETGIRDGWTASLDTGVADLATRHVEAFAAGPLSPRTGLMLTGSDEASDRFLDPVDFDNFHNGGRSTSGGAQLAWRATANTLTASLQGGRDNYDVPNSLAQEAAAQDQRQRTTQLLMSGTWQRVISDRTVFQISTYRRHGTAELFPSERDTPVTAGGRLEDTRAGALLSVTHQRSRHTLKLGGETSHLVLDEAFSFAVIDPEEADEAGLSDAALEHGPENPFEFSDSRRPSLWSLFAQDAFQAGSRVTINFGLRVDYSRLLIHESQVSPRVGAAYQLRPGTTLRGSWQRLFQPPQAEYLLLASSEDARRLSPFVDDASVGSGGSEIPAERQTSMDASIAQDLAGGWRVEGSVWGRRGSDVDDPNVFFGTTVTVPNSVARQHAWGLELRLAAPVWHGWSGALNYTRAKVVQFGPVTGGLFLEDEVAAIQDGTEFTPDHDQRHALYLTSSYADVRRGWTVGGAFRYQTGTPVGIDDEIDDLLDLRGAEVIDVDSGRVKARAVVDLRAEWRMLRVRRSELRLAGWVNNLTNQAYAYNFGNPFSGTHFGAPRRFGVSIRATFGNVFP